MFTFTPLLGAQYSQSKASQSIIELDGGVKILIDVGWNETFDTTSLKELEKHIPTLSLILLTHATPSHIGAFVYCCKTFPLFTQIPVYATTPVIAFGRSLLQDLYACAPLASTFLPTTTSIPKENGAESTTSSSSSDPKTVQPESTTSDPTGSDRILLPTPTSEDIARYFSRINPLKYSQPHQPIPSPFSPPLAGLTVTAYNAGHTVGGTIWHIQHGMESIVYAVDWNQARENVIAGAAWFGTSGSNRTEVIEQLRKPTALVCSANGGDKFALAGGRKKRDELLLDMIRSCVAKNGTVLIPTDTSARVLELAYVLEHAWREAVSSGDEENSLKKATLHLAGKKVHGTMRLARSMLEWMDESIVREFEGGDGGDAPGKLSNGQQQKGAHGQAADKEGQAAHKGLGPFTFKHLKIIERKAKLDTILDSSGPKVILASDSSFDWGLSKDALRRIAQGPENLIILTECSSSTAEGLSETAGESLARTIWRWFGERKDGVALEKTADGELLEQVHSGGRELTIVDVQKGPLASNELPVYQQYLATQRQLQNTAQGRGKTDLEEAPDALDDASSSTSSEDSESEQQGKVLNFSTSLAHSNRNKLALTDADLGVNILLRRRNVYDYDVRGKRGRERMFPYVAPKKRGDQYGEFIRPEEYLRAEEREEAQMQVQRGPDRHIQSAPGQKRRWGEARTGEKSSPNKKQHLQGPRNQQTDVTLPNDLNLNGVDDSDTSDEEPESQDVSGPSKVTLAHSTINMNARIAYVDFAGLHDKRSLEMLIPLIQPRKLILVGGMKDETLALATECRNLLAANAGLDITKSESAISIFTPRLGDTVDASVDTNAWMVKLSRALVRRLNWQNVRTLGVVALTANLRAPDALAEAETEDTDEPSKKKVMLQKDSEEQPQTVVESRANEALIKKEIFPLLDVLPPNLAAATREVSRPLHVGDLRLADLRKLMQTAGHSAEFRGEGTLLIDGFVVVRKFGAGRIEIEASARPSPVNPKTLRHNEGTFLSVKRKIYDCLAVVS
ncbi:hypothetical protein LOZ12_000711 [Ophidiomyces ophidiicola]|nr:hypothetical protein LOZ62_001661 [Ophidiomyces ophidiicola]KAI2033074.1 hypothetical protein LOZ45_000934 [Ophidiomyces ophidiicola]KAI2056547.1 hypothetical protein LOZ38_000027 [Ophidiomyces ophidiicola]KAI2060485.1 hypothetical protein LOZ44_000107 [Ophidiomyces ophidiicola]KAI2081390.1 hypothetical protein LOZ37_001201 [Ophidiomyces ophidiicola]